MDFGQQFNRTIYIQTTLGAVEGTLASSVMLRLLDDLNVVARNFLTVHDPMILAGPWSSGDGPINLNKRSVLFVKEKAGCPPPIGNRRVSSRFTRAPIEMLLKEFRLQGYVHLPPGGDPLTRLNQLDSTFVALTSVSVIGPAEEFVTPFLAVNQAHVMSAQAISEPQPALVDDDFELAAPLDDPTAI